ncbi:MAG: argininosuccinate lyase, partial [Actinomycetales bacterium]|nr:argininosuccinate lyase [Actinomycetales bacterium]
EDKESVIDAIQTLNLVLPAMSGCVATLEFDVERMAQSAPEGFALATDIAEWLVRTGVPFSRAHEIAGACVKTAEGSGVDLAQLTDEQLSDIDSTLTPDVREVLTVVGSLNSRSTPNGTAPSSVQSQLEAAELGVKSNSSWISIKPHLI